MAVNMKRTRESTTALVREVSRRRFITLNSLLPDFREFLPFVFFFFLFLLCVDKQSLVLVAL